MALETKVLYYGDNLRILRRYIPDESVDLIYLDPPWKSDQPYNIIFKPTGEPSQAQIQVFDDTWHWTAETSEHTRKCGRTKPSDVRDFCHVVERESAEMGFFVSLRKPSKEMEEKALAMGFYTDTFGNKYQKVQILTIEDILNERIPGTPQRIPPYEIDIAARRGTK